MARLFVGELINCWVPAEFPDPWVEYTHSLCFVSNTYHVPASERDVMLPENRTQIAYYQWVPMMLLVQAILFYLPCLLWGTISKSTGTDLKHLIVLLRQIENLDPDNADKCNHAVAKHVSRALNNTKTYTRSSAWGRLKNRIIDSGVGCGKRYGNSLMTLYLFIKLLHILNAAGQLLILGYFLGTDYTLYGVEVIRQLLNNGSYQASTHFPTVTLCDFDIRSLGHNLPYTVQCTLPVNVFNEKIFVIIWFWLSFLLTVNLLSMVYWLWIAFATNRRQYVKSRLKAMQMYTRYKDHTKLTYFTNRYLRQDGHLVLRLIGVNLGEVVLAELIGKLWSEFEEEYKCEVHGKYV